MKVEETIYPRLAQRLSERALQLDFTPTEADKAFASQHTRSATSRTILLVMLKVSQYLRYLPLPTEIPVAIVKYVSACSDSHVALKKKQWVDYQRSGTHKRQARLIRDYLQWETQAGRIFAFCEIIGVKMAQTKENLADILNAIIESLILESYELPAFSTLEKIARQCRVQANEQWYDQVCQPLSPQDIANIEALFDKTKYDSFSLWQRLKEEPDKPTAQNIAHFLERFSWLKSIAVSLPTLDQLPVAKRQQFRDEAMALHSSDLRELKQAKRYTLAVTLIQTQLTLALDDLGDLLSKTVQDVENKGRLAYQHYYFEQRDQADHLIQQFQTLLKTYQQAPDENDKRQAMDALLTEHSDDWMKACDQHLARAQGNERPFIVTAYRSKRQLIFKILAALPLEGDAKRQSLIRMGAFLLALFEQHDDAFITADTSQLDLNAIPHAWKALIVVEEQVNRWKLKRHDLEVAWLITIKEQLKTFNCFVVNGHKYGDANAQLIRLDEYPVLAAEYGELTGIPIDGKALVKKLKDELRTMAQGIDDRFPQVQGARLQNGKLMLKRVHVNYSSESLEGLRTAIQNKMPHANIIDVISDTVRWLQLEPFFGPLSGHGGKIGDALFRLVVTLFCFGCNVGVQQTTESIKILSRKQVAWLNARYVNVSKLEKAIKKAVDQYAQMELPKLWGDGTHASADGTHKTTYESNLLSEFHFRYRQKGAVGYYLVSDRYIALFSHFISCGAHESWYILDGVANNDMDIKPSILHGDTHAQNYVVFALAYLLGIQLMPRIRGISKLSFFKASAKDTYVNIDSLFDDSIQWHYIEQQLPEMLRIVLSIKQGIITPSAILRRLNT